MLALNQVFRADGHVVTQVVETEFIVRTESDVGHVSTATGCRVGLVLVDTVHTQTMEHIERTHPFRVTLSQIVVDSNHMYTVSGQCVQEHRKGCHEGLTFTGRHFGNLTLMQYNTTEELYIIVYHVPGHFVTAGFPVILPDRLVAFNAYEVASLRSQFTVEFGSCHFDFFIFRESAGRIFHDGKSLGKDFVEHNLILVKHFLFQFIDLCKDGFTLFQFGRLDGSFQLFDFLVLFNGRVLDTLFQLFRLGTKFIVAQFSYFRINCFHFVHPRLNFLHVTSSLVSEQLAYKFIKSHCVLLFLLFSKSKKGLFTKPHKDNQKTGICGIRPKIIYEFRSKEKRKRHSEHECA